MTFSAKCWKRRLAALVTAVSLLAGCGTGGSDGGGVRACPPVVEYITELQTRAAAEVQALPEGSALEELPIDHAVMREQARACRPG